MASKKQIFFIAMLSMFALSGISQTQTNGGSYDFNDSSLITTKRLPQYNEFLSKTSNYPAKPRNMWEVGVKAGMFTVSGDIPAVIGTLGWGVHVRKSLGYLFSLRGEFIHGTGKGMHWLESYNYQKNPAWYAGLGAQRYDANRRVQGPAVSGQPNTFVEYVHNGQDRVYYNYKTVVSDLSLQGLLTLNNVRFHKRKTSAVLYGIAGIGASIYNTKVNSLNAAGTNYKALFNGINAGTHPTRKTVLSALKAGMDKTYETPADNHGARRPKLGADNTLKPSGTVGAGVAFKLGKRINIALEDRHTFIKDDLLDGQRWQEHAFGDAVMTRDFDSYNMLTLGLNYNIGAKSVEPLYWLNPLDYAYGELPKRTLAQVKPKDCMDADMDGVCDHLDKEPNTPQGCAVTTQGVTLDTDGDGVPDCKDKELITPTQCQPVDADGIGKCPEPACCDKKGDVTKTKECNFSAPAVEFKSGSCALSNDAKDALNTLAADMKASGTCNVSVTARGESKAMQKIADCRAAAIKKYLVSKGVTEGRINTSVDQTQDSNTADITVEGGM
jgi:outer membrane protein OmpA-like peptidoglycan-associated protein